MRRAMKQNENEYFSVYSTRERMGNQAARGRSLSDYDIQLFAQQSQLPPHIVQQLYEAFMERAGRDGR